MLRFKSLRTYRRVPGHNIAAAPGLSAGCPRVHRQLPWGVRGWSGQIPGDQDDGSSCVPRAAASTADTPLSVGRALPSIAPFHAADSSSYITGTGIGVDVGQDT